MTTYNRPLKHLLARKILSYSDLFTQLKVNEPGVILPVHLVSKQHVVLIWGYDLPKPIPDLMVTELAISGTLSFDGMQSFCYVPWSAVTVMYDLNSRGFMYEESEGVRVKPEKLAEVVSLADYKLRKALERGPFGST